MNPFAKKRKPPTLRKDRTFKDGRVFLADKSELRREVFERSGGQCEEIKKGWRKYLTSPGIYEAEVRCDSMITLKDMELSHKKHGHGFRDDSPESCIASCRDCHQNGKHGSKCSYPRRAGKVMKAAKAKEYWLGKACFCSTPEAVIPKSSGASFCDLCLSKLPESLWHDIQHTEGADYLKCLAECETAILQWRPE